MTMFDLNDLASLISFIHETVNNIIACLVRIHSHNAVGFLKFSLVSLNKTLKFQHSKRNFAHLAAFYNHCMHFDYAAMFFYE
jgi:hypothetical protein